MEIKVEYIKTVNFAQCHNGVAVCQYVVVKNKTGETADNVTVSCSGEFVEDYCSQVFGQIKKGESIKISDFRIQPSAQQLLQITEHIPTSFTITVRSGNRIIAEQSFDLDFMPYDHWLGTSITPQSIVSFVTPNHPTIRSIIIKAAAILKKVTGESSFLGYKTGNTNDVRIQLVAVYAALHELGIIYRTMPASFEEIGQRVTLPDQVVASKIGNCLELTLLFASVLEAIGINSGIIFQEGHAYLAVWLVNDCYPYSICDDASYIEKKCSRGIDEMTVIECTQITSEKTSYETAVSLAEKNLAEHSKFVMFIDVWRARLECFRPLPMRVLEDGVWKIEEDGVEHDFCIDDMKEHDRFDLTTLRDAKHEPTKFDIWERKLLDFSLRNTLLNLHPRRKAIQFISFDVDRIEDNLQDGEEYVIEAKPDMELNLPSSGTLVRSKTLEELRELASTDIEHHRLHTYQTETETQTTLKNIYRAARNAIEETGANSLFLAIGTLRWYETTLSEVPRYAPLLLLPVEMVRKKGKYYIRTRDEDITLNITLMEFLRQNYDIRINGLDTLPKDKSGVDVPLIFALLRDALKDQKRWDVEEECLLGTFSFSKFLMWNDVHNNREKLRQNSVVDSLVENRLTWTPEPLVSDLKSIDQTVAPSDLALPVAVDSSQMAAIIEGGKGNSFILYGPPGTGKSQTITNLIANALYQGKRVLFVAEKMAALSVVQSRLAKIGLAPFCLELHSNKASKRHVLEQLDKALKVAHIKSPTEYSATAEKIFSQRKELIEYMEALHNVDEKDNLSLYDCILRYESIDAPALDTFKMEDALDTFIASEGVKGMEEMLGSKLETVVKLVGQPYAHPLKGMRVSRDMLMATAEVTAQMNEAASTLSECDSRREELAKAKSLREVLLRDNDEQLLQEDAKALYDSWREAKTKWFLPRIFAKRNFIEKMRQYNRLITENDIDTVLNNLLDYKAKHDELEKSRTLLRNYFGMETAADEVPSVHVITYATECLSRWVKHAPKMRDWLHWSEYKDELCSRGMACVADALESRETAMGDLRDSFLKALFRHKTEEKMSRSELLATFEGMIFDEKVKNYRKLAEDFQMLTQKELYARLAARIPRVTDGIDSSSEIGLLNRNISNGGRGVSLRDLFDQIPTLMPRLCPCMLMSPMSVAQFLGLDQEKFDLVVFDEASQMPTSEAVGAIARGKSLIVVGDPKQMPPTSFFSSTTVDEDEAAIDDMESILEDCRTLEIPSLQLNWHYRSRHESLIAFSNNEYYDGSLITFPSTDDQRTKVQYVPVTGFYDKGGKRSNKAEAEAIIKEIVRRLKDAELAKQSIGVIAFSVVQQGLIEDLLQDTLDKNKDLRDVADAMYEPIFVKNLENVQGDERDVILFSIGYGPDKSGKVSMNFGPLNNSGGERRLNVAVSRARQEMIVFSTLKSSQIDLRRSQARGVEGLKHFLEYAETQSLAMSAAMSNQRHDTVVAEDIAKELTARGFVTRTNIGRSQFKVDIAVSDASSPDVYRLGILLDGEGYRDTQTTRDREVVQPSVLGSLKWSVMRVWSVDWFNNRDRVLSRIMEQLETAPTVEEPRQEKVEFDVSDETIEETATAEKPYIEFSVSKEKAMKMPNTKLVDGIINTEQPVSFMQICRKVCAFKDAGRVTPSVQRELGDWIKEHYYVENDRKGQVVWLSKEASIDYKWYRQASGRDVIDIPMIEIKNVAREAITEQFALQTDHLTLIVAKKLGFTRRGTNVDSAIKEAISQLKAEGIVEENEGKLTISN